MSRVWIDKFAYYKKNSVYVLFTVWDKSIQDQKLLKTSDDRPVKQIQDLWQHEYSIRLVTHTGSVWVVVGDKKEHHEPQNFAMDKKLPMQEIHDAIDAKSDILFLHYSKGEWILITEKEEGKNPKLHQEVHLFDKFPDVFIRDEVWDKHMVVRHLAFGGGKWVLIIGSPRTDDVSQEMIVKNNWPGEQLLQCIQDEKNIHTLEWDEADNIWGVVSEKNPGHVHSILTTNYFPESKFKELGVIN